MPGGAPNDDNHVVHDRLSARTGEFALVIGFTLVAVYEATRFQTYGGPLDRTGSIGLSVLALVPLALALARRWPALAAAASTLLVVVVLRTENAPLTVASFCITLYLLAELVIRRGLLLAAPLLLPFFVIFVERIRSSHNAFGSAAPLLFAVAAVAVGESLRRRRQAVAALGATEEAMA